VSEDPLPWWASAADAEGLDDVDPIEAFRAARRPTDADPGEGPAADADPGEGPAADADPGEGPAADADAGARGADPGPAAPPHGSHRPELCGICPLCGLARSLEQTHPELLEHLTEAARHLAAAARALVDAPAPPDGTASDTDRGTRSSSGGDQGALHHIPLDTGRRAAGDAGTNHGGGDPGDTDGAGGDG